MTRCPTCGASYPDGVLLCPRDRGRLVAITPSPADAEALGATTPAPASAPALRELALGSTTPAPPEPRPGTPAPPRRTGPTPAPIAGGSEEGDRLAPGTMVGEYQVAQLLGQGGMGTVYAAVHPLIGKRAAIKVLKAALSHDRSIVQRFVQEARSVNQIGHRNIVDIFSFGELPSGRCYYVMEMLEGQSLAERLHAPPPPTLGEAIAILREVCDALAAAHETGIVHRDLKPENIFLVDGKAGRAVKLLDFGIAKLLRGNDGPGLAHTQTGVPMGTPLYMSPEQCVGGEIDARSDIYSLGVVMFEMFTGKRPFGGKSYIEVVNCHISRAPPRPSELVHMPPALERLVLDCMEKEPAARPQSVPAIQERLAAIASAAGDRQHDPRTVAAPLPPGAAATDPPRTAAQARRPRIGLGIVLGALALAGVAGGAALFRARTPPPAPAPVAPAPEAPPTARSPAPVPPPAPLPTPLESPAASSPHAAASTDGGARPTTRSDRTGEDRSASASGKPSASRSASATRPQRPAGAAAKPGSRPAPAAAAMDGDATTGVFAR